jgi:hypothetical protein
MTNEHRGETPITLGDKTYELRLTTNRMAALEVLLDCRGMIRGRLLGAGAETVRAVLYVCLTQPLKKGLPPCIKQPFSLDDMGDLIDAEGPPTQDGPISRAYWELLVNTGGFIEREDAERLGLIEARKGGPKGIVPAVEVAPVKPELVEVEAAVAGI